MAFGKELGDMFKYLAAGKDLYECELYTKLQDSLLLMPNRNGCSCQIELIHGQRFQVTFKSKMFTKLPIKKSCELSDMAFLVYKRNPKPEGRFFFLQNKNAEIIKRIHKNDAFKASIFQWELLAKKRSFEYNSNNYDILLKAKCPSISNYGVFFQDGKKSYDMALYASQNTKISYPAKMTASAKNRDVYIEFNGKKDSMLVNADGIKYYEGLSSIEKFGDALVSLQIGEPLNAVLHSALVERTDAIESKLLNEFKNLNFRDDNNSNTYNSIPRIHTWIVMDVTDKFE